MERYISDSVNLPVIRIGEVAKVLGISASTLRQYEDLGLVLPFKEESGQRMYSVADITWLRRLHQYFAETRTGPTALARLMRLMPTHAMRFRRIGLPCSVQAADRMCWQANATLRRKCRECPAYLEKDMVLDFEKHFRIMLR